MTLLILAATLLMQQTPDQLEKIKLMSGTWMKQTQQAEALTKQKKFAEAEQIYLNILQQRQELGLDLLSEYDHLANLYEGAGQKDKAEKALTDMIAERRKACEGFDDQTVAWPMERYADMLQRHGKVAEAKAVRNKALAIEKATTTIPRFSQSRLAIGSAERIKESEQMRLTGERWLKSDNYDKGYAYFKQAVALDPNNAKAWSDLADSERFKEQFVKARADYNRALKLDPKLASAWIGRAWVNEDENKFAAAIADFDRAIALDPKDTETMGSRAKLLDNIGRHKEAVEGYNEVIAVNPDLYWPYVQRAVAYTNLKDYAKAIADYTFLMKRSPEDPDYYQFRAECYQKFGDKASATADFAMYKKLSR